jgi:chemotaxis family two-component system response regulator Rcp1
MNPPPGKLLEILVVDDDPADIRLTLEALKRTKSLIHVSTARDGLEALVFLRREEKLPAAPVPDLILLDLNMPRMNGRELLRVIKKDAALIPIPVVILTTSQAEQDIKETYQLLANCYVTKPTDFRQFMTVMSSITDFWFTVVQLPSH